MKKIALWGCGQHAIKNILPAIAQSEKLELVGVCTRSISNGEEAVAQWGGRYWQDPDVFLASDAFDIVYLASPTGLHYRQGLKVLHANKHLYCEKSLTGSGEESLKLIKLAQEKNLVLAETFMFLYHQQFIRLSEFVNSPNFGEVVSIECRFGIPKLETPGFRQDVILGGGAFLDMACYPVALLLSLSSEAPAVIVAEMNKSYGDLVDKSGYSLLYYANNGCRANVEWAYDVAYRNEVMVWGTKQSVYADRIFSKKETQASTLSIRDTHGEIMIEPILAKNAFVRMFACFDKALSSVDFREVLWVQAKRQAQLMLAISEAAYKSSIS